MAGMTPVSTEVSAIRPHNTHFIWRKKKKRNPRPLAVTWGLSAGGRCLAGLGQQSVRGVRVGGWRCRPKHRWLPSVFLTRLRLGDHHGQTVYVSHQLNESHFIILNMNPPPSCLPSCQPPFTKRLEVTLTIRGPEGFQDKVCFHWGIEISWACSIFSGKKKRQTLRLKYV